jgi:hypothetical protein
MKTLVILLSTAGWIWLGAVVLLLGARAWQLKHSGRWNAQDGSERVDQF